MTEKTENKIRVKAKQVTDNLISFMQELDTVTNKENKELKMDAEYYQEHIEDLEKELNYQKQARSIAENAVVDLQKENAELKCECRRCVYTDGPCILSDYRKDRNGICDHFKDVFDEVVELKDEQKELLKDTAIYDSMLTKAKTLLQKVADVCGYPNYDIPVELYSDIADFLKDSEVEK